MTRTDLVVSQEAHVSRARRVAAAAAERAGLPMAKVHKVALASTELSTNLLKHAGDGIFSVVALPGRVDVLAADRGPGIRRLERSLRDGYSTTGTMGGGLGAIRRAADFSDAYSLPGHGTVVLARWHVTETAPSVRIGVARLTAPGEVECGDQWAVATCEDTVTVGLVDGLGHGPGAATAGTAAAESVTGQAGRRPALILDAMHASLARTRGATVAIAQFAPTHGRMRFCGMGNISARVYAEAGAPVQRLLSRPGIVGVGGPQRQTETASTWNERAWLVLHTDGVSDRWTADNWPGLLRRDPAVVAAWVLGQQGRGRDDACVVAVAGGD